MDILGKKAKDMVEKAVHEKLAGELIEHTNRFVDLLKDKIGDKSSETLQHINGFQETVMKTIQKLKGTSPDNLDEMKKAFQQTANEIKEASTNLQSKLNPEHSEIVQDDINKYTASESDHISKAISVLG